MKNIIFIVFMLFVFGCANPFTKYYVDLTKGIDVTNIPSVILPTDEPKIFNGTNIEKDLQTMLENGFAPLGYSYFNAANFNKKSLDEQAKKVHACIVVVYSKYTHTESGAYPLLLPDIKTSTTSLSGSIFGSGGGFGNFFGTSRTTTYDTQTIYVPYNIRKFDYLTTYWIKKKPPVFGAYTLELTTAIRQKIGSNKGLLVMIVQKDSPAFNGDIVSGDILKKIGDVEINYNNSLEIATEKYAGKKVNILLLRDGKEIIKEIQFNQKP
ncbi:MAG: PDZ domain-containing protein [Desulfobaccales bacterium]|nr:PDZ domain-containing protein [Desulfobaccales bacterium]